MFKLEGIASATLNELILESLKEQAGRYLNSLLLNETCEQRRRRRYKEFIASKALEGVSRFPHDSTFFELDEFDHCTDVSIWQATSAIRKAFSELLESGADQSLLVNLCNEMNDHVRETVTDQCSDYYDYYYYD